MPKSLGRGVNQFHSLHHARKEIVAFAALPDANWQAALTGAPSWPKTTIRLFGPKNLRKNGRLEESDFFLDNATVFDGIEQPRTKGEVEWSTRSVKHCAG
jgi:hypothetical protein